MRIKMKTLSAGPNGILLPGDEIDVSESEAKLLCDGEYAERIEKAPIVREIVTEAVGVKEPVKRGRKSSKE